MRSRNLSWQLVLLSAVSLFLELAIIRWLSSEIRIFAYFKNLPLMAAFLGFGIGFSLPERQDLFVRWFPRLICLLSILIAGAAGLGITHVIFVDPRQYFLLGSGFGDHDPQFVESFLKTAKAILVIVGLFLLDQRSGQSDGDSGVLGRVAFPMAAASVVIVGICGTFGFLSRATQICGCLLCCFSRSGGVC
jgi:hypothetical protein